MAELPQSSIENIVMTSTEPYGAPIARKETNQVAINLCECGSINASYRRNHKTTRKNFYQELNCNFKA